MNDNACNFSDARERVSEWLSLMAFLEQQTVRSIYSKWCPGNWFLDHKGKYWWPLCVAGRWQWLSVSLILSSNNSCQLCFINIYCCDAVFWVHYPSSSILTHISQVSLNQLCCFPISCQPLHIFCTVFTALWSHTSPRLMLCVVQKYWNKFYSILFYSILFYSDYHQICNISCILLGNTFFDHSDVVGASPVGDAPTTSSFST